MTSSIRRLVSSKGVKGYPQLPKRINLDKLLTHPLRLPFTGVLDHFQGGIKQLFRQMAHFQGKSLVSLTLEPSNGAVSLKKPFTCKISFLWDVKPSSNAPHYDPIYEAPPEYLTEVTRKAFAVLETAINEKNLLGPHFEALTFNSLSSGPKDGHTDAEIQIKLRKQS